MAQVEIPAPADRMAVLEMSELPGRASMIDCAFFFGSSTGVVDCWRLRVRGTAGRERGRADGRSLAAPKEVVSVLIGPRQYMRR